MIQYIRSSYRIDNSLLYIFSSKEIPFLNVNKREHLTFLTISLEMCLRHSDTDSENVSLIWHSVSDGQKTCSSKDVSLIGI